MALILIVFTALVSYLAFERPQLFRRLQFNAVEVVQHRDYSRMLTHGFVHADWMHLIFNMLVLYFFGPTIEQAFVGLFPMGRLVFLFFYLSAIVVASVLSAYLHRHQPGYNSVGASGAVSAVVFAFILLAPLQDICIWGVICMPGVVWGLVYLGYSYYQAQYGHDNTNHHAHLSGAVYGFLFPLFFEPQLILYFFEQLIP